MKATLKFNLPEEKNEYDLTTRGADWALVSFDMDEILRVYLKHGHSFKTVDEAIEEIRNRLYETLEDYGLNLNMIQ